MKIFRRNYIILFRLGFLFAAPGISAYVLYLHPNWLGEAKTNKGRLLSPPVLFAHPNAPALWQLVLWHPAACTRDCMAQLDKLARIRLALGRHLYEVSTLLLMDSRLPALSGDLRTALDDQDIHLLRLSKQERESMPVLNSTPAIFIINPEHYLIMAYAPTVKPEDIFYDLKQLITR